MDQKARIWLMLKERAAAMALSDSCARIKDPAPATLEGLRDAISKAITAEMDALKLQQELVARFSLSPARALSIARTELSRAFNTASITLMKAGGIEPDDINSASAFARELYAPSGLVQRSALKKRAAAVRANKRMDAKASKLPVQAKPPASEFSDTEIGISFNLGNDGLIEFVRSYHFADSARRLGHGCLSRRRAARKLRSLMLRSLTEGWSLIKLRNAVDAIFVCGPDLSDQIASDETIRAANAADLAAFLRSGIRRKSWVLAGPEGCARCKGLDGRVIGVSDNFSGGCPFPPLHSGCTCSMKAEL